MNLTANQIHQIGELSDQWSFLWDKRRALWIAAEDCPDGEQVEDADLDVLLARLPVIAAALADGYLDRTNSVHRPPGRRPCHR